MNQTEQYVYHLVTRNKMQLGQIIYFDQHEKNTLYRFFFEQEQHNAQGEDAFQILLSRNSENGLHMEKEDADVVLNYAGSSVRAIRETIVEMVRLQEFPYYPSRLSCLYVTKSYDDLLKWRVIFESFNRKVLQIVKLKVDGNCFEGDGELLPKEDGASFAKKIEQARSYWQNNNTTALPEMLVDGRIEVVEILEEFE
ncbi:DUF2441 domain-containing protein [Solibacillus sp. MA9]|uniref:DUF2441 domain-containing protein n=1 Tax=Solibacillus palustris TaxID=2908203 RepID=A0ABS9UHM0_9BACL|nr:DUF2441 domain-containing protein [Solibacillus sp. MA9]MCH7323743.1 DUF2441 domain-containing protein [Solibacillus sp. MA9]